MRSFPWRKLNKSMKGREISTQESFAIAASVFMNNEYNKYRLEKEGLRKELKQELTYGDLVKKCKK